MTIAKPAFIDLSAKLLATENVSVRRANAQTASFDIQSRVLTLPIWKDMTPEIEGMLVGHEVGHALYTSHDYMDPIKEDNKIHSYLNVLEDVRIEKLMKRKYPGIRKTMNEGYRQLNEKDFFGVQKSDLKSLILIDKINLYFKAGFDCGVTFTIGEKNIIDRAERTETIADVIELAKEVYAYSYEEMESRLEQMELTNPDDVEELDIDDLDDMDDDFGGSGGDTQGEGDDEDLEDTDSEPGTPEDESEDSDTPPKNSKNFSAPDSKPKEQQLQEKIEKELESKTDKVFSKKLAELADSSTEFNYHTLDLNDNLNHIVGYRQIIEETSEVDGYLNEVTKSDLIKFKLDSSRVVSYLNKEFEMRKSAQMYKRAQVSKSGSLDMKKVWAYKLKDDLFKRITTIPEGKNHGMIFLLDWSGSMDEVLQDSVKQVITLAMFCRSAQIPYQVFAFSNQYQFADDNNMRYHIINNKQRSLPDGVLNNACNDFAMLELLSTKMSNVEFNTMVRRLNVVHRFGHCKNGAYSTGGTPLNEALGWLVNYIPKFIAANNIEKMTLITLTDGEGSSLRGNGRNSLNDSKTSIVNNSYQRRKQKHYLQDTVTKKTYAINEYSNTHTEAILRLIKDRYGIKSVGFFITGNTRNALRSAINSNLSGFNGSDMVLVDDMRKDFRSNGFYSMKNTGRDDLFIIPQSALAIVDNSVVVEDNQTAKQIAKNFTRVMASQKTSRVLLNQFIGYVA